MIRKVGFFPLHSFVNPGGVKRHVLALHKEFQGRGISSKIIIPRRLKNERYGKDIIFLGTSLEFSFYGSEGDFTICLKPSEIKRVLSQENFDILHFHNFGLHSMQILAASKSVNILTFHANIKGSPTLALLFSAMKKFVMQKLDGIICVAPFQLAFFKDFRGPKVVIPNGVDLNTFHPGVTPIKKYKDGKLNILFLGRLEKRKGLIYLLYAYRVLRKKFDNIRLLIVGEGPLRKEYEGYVLKHNLQDVVFEPKTSPENASSYYATCDIFVSPAIFGESFGMVLIEAMACGKPVVAFANEGYKGVLTGKGAKFLVPPQDWRELARKIEILIKSEDKRKEMRQWGLHEAKKYAWPKIADQVLAFYNRVIGNRS